MQKLLFRQTSEKLNAIHFARCFDFHQSQHSQHVNKKYNHHLVANVLTEVITILQVLEMSSYKEPQRRRTRLGPLKPALWLPTYCWLSVLYPF